MNSCVLDIGYGKSVQVDVPAWARSCGFDGGRMTLYDTQGAGDYDFDGERRVGVHMETRGETLSITLEPL